MCGGRAECTESTYSATVGWGWDGGKAGYGLQDGVWATPCFVREHKTAQNGTKRCDCERLCGGVWGLELGWGCTAKRSTKHEGTKQ